MKTQLTASKLHEILDYNELTGVFTWKPRGSKEFESIGKCARWNGQYSGKQAGTLANGYISINIYYKIYRAHRLAWLYMYRVWPAKNLDHINGVCDDNRIDNLREATQAENRQNLRGAKSNNSTGLLGVSKSYKDGKFRASINHKHLGLYDTAEEAHEAYVNAKRVLHLFNVKF